LFRNAADRNAELNWLKTLVKQLVDKVNAPGDTPAARIAAVEDCVMATHTGVDYSTQPRGFQGGAPEDVDEIEVIQESHDGHGDAIAESIHPQSVLSRLFD
jgi:putative N-acetylmannosamine-6-phosphate epimerase